MIVAEFFLSLSEFNRHIEIIQRSLNSNKSFDPYSAFRRISGSHTTKISCDNILEFLQLCNYDADPKYLQILIDLNNPRHDGYLNFKGFSSIVLSPLHQKKSTQRRRSYQTPEPETEVAIARFFYKATNFLKRMLEEPEFKTALKIDNFHEVFELNPHHLIDFEVFKEFFKQCRMDVGDDEIIGILRMIDINDDGRVSQDDFLTFLDILNGLTVSCIRSSTNYSNYRKFSDPNEDLFSPEANIDLSSNKVKKTAKKRMSRIGRMRKNNCIQTTINSPYSKNGSGSNVIYESKRSRSRNSCYEQNGRQNSKQKRDWQSKASNGKKRRISRARSNEKKQNKYYVYSTEDWQKYSNDELSQQVSPTKSCYRTPLKQNRNLQKLSSQNLNCVKMQRMRTSLSKKSAVSGVSYIQVKDPEQSIDLRERTHSIPYSPPRIILEESDSEALKSLNSQKGTSNYSQHYDTKGHRLSGDFDMLYKDYPNLKRRLIAFKSKWDENLPPSESNQLEEYKSTPSEILSTYNHITMRDSRMSDKNMVNLGKKPLQNNNPDETQYQIKADSFFRRRRVSYNEKMKNKFKQQFENEVNTSWVYNTRDSLRAPTYKNILNLRALDSNRPTESPPNAPLKDTRTSPKVKPNYKRLWECGTESLEKARTDFKVPVRRSILFEDDNILMTDGASKGKIPNLVNDSRNSNFDQGIFESNKMSKEGQFGHKAVISFSDNCGNWGTTLEKVQMTEDSQLNNQESGGHIIEENINETISVSDVFGTRTTESNPKEILETQKGEPDEIRGPNKENYDSRVCSIKMDRKNLAGRLSMSRNHTYEVFKDRFSRFGSVQKTNLEYNRLQSRNLLNNKDEDPCLSNDLASTNKKKRYERLKASIIHVRH